MLLRGLREHVSAWKQLNSKGSCQVVCPTCEAEYETNASSWARTERLRKHAFISLHIFN